MKNIKFSVLAVVVIIFSSYNEVKSQVSTLGHFSVDPTNYSGWDNTVTFPFQIRHDGFQPIVFSTNTVERMRIAQWGNVSIGGNLAPMTRLDVTLVAATAAAPPESGAIKRGISNLSASFLQL